jgi:archaellum component FlaC
VNAEEMRLAAKTEVEGFRKTVVGLADKNGISEIKNLIGGILNDLNTMKKDIASTEKNLQNAIIENTKLDKVVKDMMLASQAIKSIESFHTQSGDLNKLRLSLGLKAR